MAKTDLHDNPFHLLGVTTRDTRQTIIARADELALSLDPAVCQDARSALTNPRTRIGAEVRWLPGVAPETAAALLEELGRRGFMGAATQQGLPPLAKANLLAAGIQLLEEGSEQTPNLSDIFRFFATTADRIDADRVLVDINEDRASAGFAAVVDRANVADELDAQRQHYKRVLRDALDAMSSTDLVEVVTIMVDRATKSGTEPASTLINEFLDVYEVETQAFFDKEEATIAALIESASAAAPLGAFDLAPQLERLEQVARNWDVFAQPLQVGAMARGMTHARSRELAFSIRSLALKLHNDHDLTAEAQRLTTLLRELFAELPIVMERLDDDAKILADLQEKSAKRRESNLEWEQSLEYSVELGVLFKDRLAISSKGIEWKGRTTPLADVTGVIWGGTRRSINGVPTGTEYTIAFSTRSGRQTVSLRNEKAYSAFIDRLWKAVAVRLLYDLAKSLASGATVDFGRIAVSDTTVLLQRHKLFGSDPVRIDWADTKIWSANGAFLVGAKDDKKVSSAASYLQVWNVHILESLVRGYYKKGGKSLSEHLVSR